MKNILINQTIIMQSSGSHLAVVRQSSGQSSGSHQAVIRQSSGSHQVVTKLSDAIFASLLKRLLLIWPPGPFKVCYCFKTSAVWIKSNPQKVNSNIAAPFIAWAVCTWIHSTLQHKVILYKSCGKIFQLLRERNAFLLIWTKCTQNSYRKNRTRNSWTLNCLTGTNQPKF
jgi:hypothetical protein